VQLPVAGARFAATGAPDAFDGSAALVAPFTRVGWYLELEEDNAPPRFVYVEADAFDADPARLGFPTSFVLQQDLANGRVESNVDGVVTGAGRAHVVRGVPADGHRDGAALDGRRAQPRLQPERAALVAPGGHDEDGGLVQARAALHGRGVRGFLPSPREGGEARVVPRIGDAGTIVRVRHGSLRCLALRRCPRPSPIMDARSDESRR
jgi:hypothetical protein